MADDTPDIPADLDDRTVKVTYQDGGKRTIEGLCVRWRPGKAMLVKTSKKPYGDLIDAHKILSVQVIQQDNLITQTSIKPVTVRDVRRHLLNYHGWGLSAVNEISDEDALTRHTYIHAGVDPDSPLPADLGHNHNK